MKVAVILLNYNSAADCKKCIGFLQKQEKVDTEIIVVDNCSQDQDRLAAKALCQKLGCTFIANKENKGYNAGNNVGLHYAAEKGYLNEEYMAKYHPEALRPNLDLIGVYGRYDDMYSLIGTPMEDEMWAAVKKIIVSWGLGGVNAVWRWHLSGRA